jgi:hypothetical protein
MTLLVELLLPTGAPSGEEVLQCHKAGIKTFVPKPLTSDRNAESYFGKQDFIYVARDDEYLCTARAAAQLAFHEHRTWHDATLLLGLSLFYLCYQKTMHIGQTGSPDKASGT